MDVLDGDVELTEFEALDVRQVKGVGKGASGFPMLLMKGLAKADSDGDDDGDTGPTHGTFTGKHSHPHAANGAQGDDDSHEHEHSHDGDGDHGHAHASKSAGPPEWHPAAVRLAHMGAAAPDIPRGTLFKAVAADGSVDEQPDIDGGKQAIALIAKLIGYEAQELAAGCLGETWDIQLLCEAAGALKCWLGGEQATADGMGAVMDAAAKADLSTSSKNDLPDSAFAYIEPGGTKDEDGKTTPRSKRHFPIHDKAHADNAAARIAQGAEFGDKAKAKVEAAQKKFGSNSDDTSKAAVAAEGAVVDTEPQGTGDLSKAVEDAVTKATAPLRAEIESLQAKVAKVEALPVPGGPVMSVTRATPRGEDGENWTAKAAYYEQMAGTVASPADADNYRQLAAQAKAKAIAPA